MACTSSPTVQMEPPRPWRRSYLRNWVARSRQICIAEYFHPMDATSTTNAGHCIPTWVADEVQKRGAEIGLTFDGDADRCMLAGAKGNVINGDAILLDGGSRSEGAWTAHRRPRRGHNHVEHGTRGCTEALRHSHAACAGGRSLRARADAATRCGLGASNQAIFSSLTWRRPATDCLRLSWCLDLIARSGKSIDELTADLKVFPQVIVNVRVRERRPLEGIPAVVERIRAAEEELKDSGRVVIRYSGTEALARVMIEAESEEAMRRHSDAIAEAIRNELGI